MSAKNLNVSFTGVEQSSPNVTIVRVHLPTVDHRYHHLLRSDAHSDSPKNNWSLEKAHLDLALEKNAGISDLGDLFDAMQGRHDKRRCPDELKVEHKTQAYSDSIVDAAVKRYAPYAANWCSLNTGNHESAFKKHMQTDLTSRFACAMRDKFNSPIVNMGYNGWVIFRFTVGPNCRKSLKFRVMHGSGGGPVTGKAILDGRRAAKYPDADAVVTGHLHGSQVRALPRIRVSDSGREFHDEQHHIMVRSYKDERFYREEGYLAEKEIVPSIPGATWVTFYATRERKGFNVKYSYQDLF